MTMPDTVYASLTPPPTPSQGTISPLSDLLAPRRTWRGMIASSHARLADTITPYRAHIEHLAGSVFPTALGRTPNPGELLWATEAIRLLQHAEQSLAVGRSELGWKCFHEAQRMEIRGLGILANEGEKGLLRGRAVSIALEGDAKLHSWRKQTVKDLLGVPGNLRAEATVSDVTESHLILTDAFANNYHLMRVRKWQVALLAAIAIAALVTWWGAVGPSFLTQRVTGGATPLFPAGLLPSVLLFGVIGAAVSGMVALVRSRPTSIPGQLTVWTGTMARVVVGAVAALIIFLALESTVLDGADSRLILLQSFVAGFSERVLSAAVEKAGG